MKILINDDWKEGFLDEWCNPQGCRIKVWAWISIEALEQQYFIRPKRIRLIVNYLGSVGVKEVWRKILSRLKEKNRNQKYISCGLGRVIAAPKGSRYIEGEIVAFIAPNHPRCIERAVLPKHLVFRAEGVDSSLIGENEIQFLDIVNDQGIDRTWLDTVKYWSWYSGDAIPIDDYETVKKNTLKLLQALTPEKARRLPIRKTSPVREVSQSGSRKAPNSRKSAVIFGYGNYSKTIIIPSLKKTLAIDCIHEIDPTQIPLIDSAGSVKWDTSPILRISENYNVFLIAGFHHTHAPLAIAALKRNAYAVVEKPIVVSESQLEELLASMHNSSGHLFACFNRRYLPFNTMALEDMGLSRGQPVSYHCIVYEVPLPNFHWYRWENSGSRLMSNGCHWIDHFLYLNDYCDVERSEVFVAPDGTVNASITLKNGAFFSMLLTDQGSERIGVQEYIELRSDNVTIKMINGSKYQAETSNRVIRSMRRNKLKNHRAMYQKIGEMIASGSCGDSLRSVEVSSRVILQLENQFQTKYAEIKSTK